MVHWRDACGQEPMLPKLGRQSLRQTDEMMWIELCKILISISSSCFSIYLAGTDQFLVTFSSRPWTRTHANGTSRSQQLSTQQTCTTPWPMSLAVAHPLPLHRMQCHIPWSTCVHRHLSCNPGTHLPRHGLERRWLLTQGYFWLYSMDGMIHSLVACVLHLPK